MPTESSSRGFQKCPPTNLSALRSSGEGRRGRVRTSPCPHSLLCAGHPGSSSLRSSPTSHAGATIPARAFYAGDRHHGAHVAGPSWEWVQASFTLLPSSLPSAPEPGQPPAISQPWHKTQALHLAFGAFLAPAPACLLCCLSVCLSPMVQLPETRQHLQVSSGHQPSAGLLAPPVHDPRRPWGPPSPRKLSSIPRGRKAWFSQNFSGISLTRGYLHLTVL